MITNHIGVVMGSVLDSWIWAIVGSNQ